MVFREMSKNFAKISPKFLISSLKAWILTLNFKLDDLRFVQRPYSQLHKAWSLVWSFELSNRFYLPFTPRPRQVWGLRMWPQSLDCLYLEQDNLPNGRRGLLKTFAHNNFILSRHAFLFQNLFLWSNAVKKEIFFFFFGEENPYQLSEQDNKILTFTYV